MITKLNSWFKVRVFREQKLEALQLQAAITARQAEQEKELLQAAQAKEKHRRERIKDKVRTYFYHHLSS